MRGCFPCCWSEAMPSISAMTEKSDLALAMADLNRSYLAGAQHDADTHL